MVAFNHRGSCREAEPYYYDFLLDPDGPNIPDSVVRHIDACAHCRQAIRRLEGALGGVEADSQADPSGRSRDDDVIDVLSLHFEYLDEYVTCAQVKPFLPALAMPSTQISIPTPITVHLEHCTQCADDLQTIRNFELETGQLARLSRLFGENADRDLELCRRAKPYIAVLGSGSLVGIEPVLLKHMCVCPDCRDGVYAHRQSLLRQQSEASDCEARADEGPAMADIFDCVVPYGEPDAPRTSAASISEAGLEKMQRLHEALYGIAGRADSGTVTVYSTPDEDGRAALDSDDRYAAQGINVRVIRRVSEPAAAGPAVQQRGGVRATIKPLVKIAAAAAVIPLVLVLLVHTRSASGTGPDEIIDAFARVSNVHVQQFQPNRVEPVQEFWVSRKPDLLMMTQNAACTLYDMSSRTKLQTNPAQGTIGTVGLDEREYEGAREIMDHSLGFTLDGIPMDRDWGFLAHDDVNGVDVYALTWTKEASDGRAYLVRWQVDVDSQKELPIRSRLSRKYPPESEWEPQSQWRFEYPTDEEIRAAIAERFPTGVAPPI